MIYKITTDKSLETIKNELESHAKKSGFGVLGSYEFKKILESKNFPIQKDITVYELCNPSEAQKFLTAVPEISVYLPCRISVYEENGKTVLATIDLHDILDSVEGQDELKEQMKSVFWHMIELLRSWE